MEQVDPEIRADTIEILNQSKSSTSQKRSALIRKGVTRSASDWLEVLSDTCKLRAAAYRALRG